MAPRVLLLALIVLGCSSAPEATTFSFPPPSSAGSSQLDQAAGNNSGGSSAGGSSQLEAGSATGISHSGEGGGGASTMPVAGSGAQPTPMGGTASGGSTAGQPSGGQAPLGGTGGQPTAGTGTAQAGTSDGGSASAGDGGMSGEGGAGGSPETVCTSAITYAQCTGKEVTTSVCTAAGYADICGVGTVTPWKNIAHPWTSGTAYCVGDQVVDHIYGAVGVGACETDVFTCTDADKCRLYAPNTLENSKTWRGFSYESGTWRQMRTGESRVLECTNGGLGACHPCSNILCSP